MTTSFKHFEHEGWQMVAGPYDDYFSALTAQTMDPLLDAVAAGPGVKLLDVACGPGALCVKAKARGAVVTAVDFSSEMITRARATCPDIQFVEGDAEALPFAYDQFDATVMNFGLLHLDSPEKALAEAARVTRAGGLFAFTVWDKPQLARGFDIALQAIEKHGDPKVKIPAGPPFFQFSDIDYSQAAMKNAGFTHVDIARQAMIWHLPKAEDLYKAFIFGTPRTGGLLRAQPEPNRLAIAQAIALSAKQYLGPGGIEIPMAALLVTGRL